MRNNKKETRWMIMFAFESQEDQKQVLTLLKQKTKISWFNGTREASLTPDKLINCSINVGKSKQSNKRIRL